MRNKNIILCQKYNFALVKNEAFYKFGTWEELSNIAGVPVEQCGTKEEIKAELERWKNEIDFDNTKMLEIENAFLDVLNSL